MQTLGNTRYRKLPGKTISREPKVHVTPYNMQNMRMCVCTVCVCVYIYTHILFYICVHIYIYICTYIHIYIHAFIHTYILYHTCISVHIYIMVNTYIYVYFSAHTHRNYGISNAPRIETELRQLEQLLADCEALQIELDS